MEFRILGPIEVHAGGRAGDGPDGSGRDAPVLGGGPAGGSEGGRAGPGGTPAGEFSGGPGACPGGGPLPLGPPRTRAVLGILLVRPGEIVSVGQFVDELWPDQPPAEARPLVHGYLSRLRRALRAAPDGAARLVTRKPGYLLHVGDGELDLHRFEDLLGRARSARSAGALDESLRYYRRAHALWRGTPFADAPATPGIDGAVTRLAELRLGSGEEEFAVRLAVGEGAELVAALTEQVDAYPLRERPVGQLMLALHRAGRTAEALDVYRRAVARLAGELGIDPGPELRQVEVAILRGEVGTPSRGTADGPELGQGNREAAPPGPGGGGTEPGWPGTRRVGLEVGQSGAGHDDGSPVGWPGSGREEPEDGQPAAVRDGRPGQARVARAGTSRSGPVGPEPAPDVRDGAVPGPEPERVEPDAARGDESGHTRAVTGETSWPGERPAQLPTDLATFTGRSAELAHLLAPADPGAAGVTVVAVDGMAGVGKTALAVRAAHRVAGRFPDGQLFLDLHGFTEGIEAVAPGDALDRMLRALGVPGDRIPPGTEDRASLFRSAVAGRRMLLLLDNAATEDQVRPLLPATPGCLVLVTSRHRLTGLDAALPLSLDLLPPSDAVALFVRIAGPGAAADQAGTAEIVELCGRLPLAIRIAAARLRSRSGWRPAHLADRLRDHRHRLDQLVAGHRSVGGAFELSYQQLDPDQRRMFRLLGLHPGPDTDAPAAAALSGLGVPRADRLLEDLTDAHLLEQPVVGRYRFHDLLRGYAARAAADEEPATDRRAALIRLFDYYVDTAAGAATLVYPHDGDLCLCRTTTPPTRPRGVSTAPQAATWLETERQNLLAVAAQAAGIGLPEYPNRLSDVLARNLRSRGTFADTLSLHNQALAAASQMGDRRGEGHAWSRLGDLYKEVDRYDDALDAYRRALGLSGGAGDRGCEGHALAGLGILHLLTGRSQEAIGYFGRSLAIAREIGDRNGERRGLVGLGILDKLLGRPEAALDHLGRAVRIAAEIGDLPGEAHASVSLAELHRQLGRPDRAVEHLHRALDLVRESGDRAGEAHASVSLAASYRQLGLPDQAIGPLRRALAIADQIGDRQAEQGALAALGEAQLLLGRHDEALDAQSRALAIAREIGDRNGELAALNGLGRTRRATVRPDLAVRDHTEALALALDLGQPHDQAGALDGRAAAQLDLGRPDLAGADWRRALELFEAVDAPEVGRIREALAALA
ncbi:AfsR/SARP family transcriptional regulator [Longispora urticae]